ncbi:MAG: 4Fe-4S binding protein [Bacteroidales bacterium]
MNKEKEWVFPLSVSLLVVSLLAVIQIVSDRPMLAVERFVRGGGWVEIAILAVYGFFVSRAMLDVTRVPVWRRRIWLIFCVVFFSQFALGLFADSRFLMTGKLHLPLPFMILGGPVYRADISFMTIFFLSTVILSGPAWCSHLCYFGALDSLSANGRTGRKPLKKKWLWKTSLVVLVIVFALVFRLLGLSGLQTVLPALALGLVGVGVMIHFSRRQGRMVHCVAFCPIGTLVNVGRHLSPFRMSIQDACTNCMRCIPSCKYDALNREDILKRKPGLTCTLCGDCVQSCEVSAIRYNLFRFSPETSRRVFLFITISLHVLFLGMGRM